MGFFDTIDRLKDAETEHLPPGKISSRAGRITQAMEVRPAKGAEKLNFLRPCPLCNGRNFIFGKNGGFFCPTCQPGIPGTPVEAGGPDRQDSEKEAGFPLKSETGFPGSVKADTTDQERAYFATAWSWIKGNMPDLLKAGWTRAALLKRSKYRYPTGWGIAWFQVWHQEGLVVTIGEKGKIIFSFFVCGKEITQTATPPLKK